MKEFMPIMFFALGVFLLVASLVLGQQMNEHWAINKIVSMITLGAGSFSIILGVVTYILAKEDDHDVW